MVYDVELFKFILDIGENILIACPLMPGSNVLNFLPSRSCNYMGVFIYILYLGCLSFKPYHY